MFCLPSLSTTSGGMKSNFLFSAGRLVCGRGTRLEIVGRRAMDRRYLSEQAEPSQALEVELVRRVVFERSPVHGSSVGDTFERAVNHVVRHINPEKTSSSHFLGEPLHRAHHGDTRRVG